MERSMERSSELGYRNLNVLLQSLEDQRRIDAEYTDAACSVFAFHTAAASFVAYRCNDAQAWGTLYRFTSAADAAAKYDETVSEAERLDAALTEVYDD